MGLIFKEIKKLYVWGVLSLVSCTGSNMPVQDTIEYDTLSVIHTMLQDSTVKDMLYNADTKRSYRDSLYIVKDGLSDSILSAVKVPEKKIAFLPPDRRPYSYMNSTTQQIMWLRVFKIDTKAASGEVTINGYNIGREIEMFYESGEWKIKNVSQSHY
ncbi:MAG: hypothetical protein ACO1NU_05750 [Arcticibacter sp.]